MTTTDKLETGYQYICNNLISKSLNYQMTERDTNVFHILPPNTDENVARNIDIKCDLENISKNG